MSKVPLLRINNTDGRSYSATGQSAGKGASSGQAHTHGTKNRVKQTSPIDHNLKTRLPVRVDYTRSVSANSITNVLNNQRQPHMTYNGSSSTHETRSAYAKVQQLKVKSKKHKSGTKRQTKVKSKVKSHKLNTLNGVTLPTTLNVLSILLFLRFGFIIGQMGTIGTIGLLLLSYGINLLTTLSVSAIATNGTVKGGGAYYMLSRSLGVEFGGGIGVIFYIGQILNSSMNVAGLVEPLMYNFNERDGVLGQILPVSYWWQFTYCTIILAVCIIVALIGSAAVSHAGKYLCMILIASIITIPISSIIVKPFDSPAGLHYSGLSWSTFIDNLWPHFTKGAAGSQMNGVETFNDLFGIFFPATAGILAGASMSGDLESPSKSIPRGTLDGLLITFSCYLIVILTMGACIPRELLHADTEILQGVNLSPFIILAGELSTSIFSIIVGIVGAAKLLQAIARDEILPGLSIFGRGDSVSDDPKEAILLTWVICQLFLFADLNQIATFITMAFLMTFIVTNLACFLLKLGSAPNFRPSFKYFSTKTAFGGTMSCIAAMFIVDGMSACVIITVLAMMMICIHFVSPPKSWGDVSQSLIYHQVRKYLFKLRQDNVKYWRPQILLLVDNPRTSWKLISFCNSLKKGGLYVLGHVFVIDDSHSFQDNIETLNSSRENWKQIRNITGVKAFVQMSVAPTFPWGVRNVFLGSGLGGMKPNITIIGFYDLSSYDGPYSEKIPRKHLQFESELEGFHRQVKVDVESLPTDAMARLSPKVALTDWISSLEDLSLLNSNIAVAKGLGRLELPGAGGELEDHEEVKYIDLYPIQMAQSTYNVEGGSVGTGGIGTGTRDKNLLTTNFDTCTLILQMGAILHTVPQWKKRYRLRVVVFVEESNDVEEERSRVVELLEILRMTEAEVVVICLRDFELKMYDYLVRGEEEILGNERRTVVEELLQDDVWWQEEKRKRRIRERTNGKGRSLLIPTNVNVKVKDKYKSKKVKVNGGKMKKNLKRGLSKSYSESISRANQMGVSVGRMSMQAGTIDRSAVRRFARAGGSGYSDSELECSSGSSSGSGSDSDSEIQSQSQSQSLSSSDGEADLESVHSLSSIASASSASTMKRSAFTAERIPKSRVCAEAEGNDASIVFEEGEEEGEEEEEEEDGDGDGDGDEESCGEGMTPEKAATATTITTDSNPGPELSLGIGFGGLSRRAQFLVLNELMGRCSSAAGTALLFCTLPLPEPGSHRTAADAVEWAADVELWTQGLPPLLLLAARSVTVTSAL